MEKIRVGVAVCGSFCTLSRTVRLVKRMVDIGYDVIPIFSFNVSELDTRFYSAIDFRKEIESITHHDVIDRIVSAEPIGPKDMCDIMVVLPCTGNTLAKLAHGITDTPTTMAVKSHIRNNKPVLIALATNDGLGASYENIARLTSTKNFYFVPYEQDNSVTKPKSLVYVEDKVLDALKLALEGKSMPVIEGSTSH